MEARLDETCVGQIDLALVEDTSKDALHEDEAEQPLRECEVDKEGLHGDEGPPLLRGRSPSPQSGEE